MFTFLQLCLYSGSLVLKLDYSAFGQSNQKSFIKISLNHRIVSIPKPLLAISLVNLAPFPKLLYARCLTNKQISRCFL